MSADTATVAARMLLHELMLFEPKRLHISVITQNRKVEPTVPWHWRRMNMFGVTFSKRDIAEAEVWAANAIRAGYRPFGHYRKNAAGTYYNAVRRVLERDGVQL